MIAVVLAAVAGYLANVTLGTLVLTGVLDTRGFRWLHHVLYIATFALAVAAVAVLLLGHQILAGLLLAPALAAFAAIPFAGTHTRRHPLLGLLPAPFYLSALLALT